MFYSDKSISAIVNFESTASKTAENTTDPEK